jgi:hypothetical protein
MKRSIQKVVALATIAISLALAAALPRASTPHQRASRPAIAISGTDGSNWH